MKEYIQTQFDPIYEQKSKGPLDTDEISELISLIPENFQAELSLFKRIILMASSGYFLTSIIKSNVEKLDKLFSIIIRIILCPDADKKITKSVTDKKQIEVTLELTGQNENGRINNDEKKLDSNDVKIKTKNKKMKGVNNKKRKLSVLYNENDTELKKKKKKKHAEIKDDNINYEERENATQIKLNYSLLSENNFLNNIDKIDQTVNKNKSKSPENDLIPNKKRKKVYNEKVIKNSNVEQKSTEKDDRKNKNDNSILKENINIFVNNNQLVKERLKEEQDILDKQNQNSENEYLENFKILNIFYDFQFEWKSKQKFKHLKAIKNKINNTEKQQPYKDELLNIQKFQQILLSVNYYLFQNKIEFSNEEVEKLYVMVISATKIIREYMNKNEDFIPLKIIESSIEDNKIKCLVKWSLFEDESWEFNYDTQCDYLLNDENTKRIIENAKNNLK